MLREDVSTLRDINNRSLPYPINRTTIGRLDARVQVLEQQMSVVLRVLDLRCEPLMLTSSQLRALYYMAQHHLDEQWSPHEEEMWLDTFVRINMGDFENMYKMVEDEHPWRPLYQLCNAMLQAPCEPNNKLRLTAGRANLEKIAYIWATTRGVTDKSLSKLIEKGNKAVKKVVRKRRRKMEQSKDNK